MNCFRFALQNVRNVVLHRINALVSMHDSMLIPIKMTSTHTLCSVLIMLPLIALLRSNASFTFNFVGFQSDSSLREVKI